MKSFWLILFLLTILISQDPSTVQVYRVERDDRIEVYAQNSNIYPVTIELDLQVEHLKSDRNLPYTGIISAQGNEKLLDLLFTDKDQGWNIQSSYTYYPGNIFAQHQDSYAYRLPYPKGESYEVAQGFGGTFSHQGDLQHSLDFDMPEGTPVYAARDGKVVMLEQENKKGGPDESMMEFANYITVLHDDGTFADYSHLRYKSVIVQLGQEVKRGQIIGYSGATGFATGPHLHFVIKKAKKGGGFFSIPVEFTTVKGIQELREGESYIGY